MTIMKCRLSICIFFLFLAVQTPAQDTKVKAVIDRNHILIGERIKLTLEADIPETAPIRFFYLDTINHFEFIHKGKIDTANTPSGTVLRQDLVITSFDSGRYYLPAFSLDPSGGPQTDSMAITVSYTPFDTGQAYHDVKDIIEVEIKPEKNNWLIYIVGAAAILAVAAFFLTGRKKKLPVSTHTITEDPYARAISELDALLQSEPESREFFTRLTDSFRRYLSHRKNINSLQKTTSDLLIPLHSIGLDKTIFHELSVALRMSDLVKFARYEPGQEDRMTSYTIIRKVIGQIEEDHNKQKVNA
ncbi:MAG: LPXTG cell wall anchor domain-containing protein [Terrimonas sp.]|nr:LPXTG cell wall anchor domain-containing protein [Terrimonas sp.]